MKKLIALAGAALVLVGCNQGGTGDDYGTSSGSSTNYSRHSTYEANTNQGAATSPGGTQSGAADSSVSNNPPIMP